MTAKERINAALFRVTGYYLTKAEGGPGGASDAAMWRERARRAERRLAAARRELRSVRSEPKKAQAGAPRPGGGARRPRGGRTLKPLKPLSEQSDAS